MRTSYVYLSVKRTEPSKKERDLKWMRYWLNRCRHSMSVASLLKTRGFIEYVWGSRPTKEEVDAMWSTLSADERDFASEWLGIEKFQFRLTADPPTSLVYHPNDPEVETSVLA